MDRKDFLNAIEVVKIYNQQRLKDIQFKGRKLCSTCGSMVKSAVAGYCENCWETGDYSNGA